MKYCPRCGVVLSDAETNCALCGSPAVTEKPLSAVASGPSYPVSEFRGQVGGPPHISGAKVSGDDVLSGAERRRIAVELLSVTLGIALVITILVDLFTNHAFTWSRYSSVGIISAWLFSAMPLILFSHPWVLFSVLAPSLLAAVFCFMIFDSSPLVFLSYGLPISLAFEASAAGTGAILASLRRKGLNALGVVLCGISAFCFGIEATVDLNTLHSLSPDWSVVVSFALVPSAALLFYLHYRIVDRASLRKLFRL